MFVKSKIGFAVLLLAAMAAAAIAQETKYASGTTSAGVTFGPERGHTTIKAVFATSDLLGGTVAIYARGSAGKAAPTANATNGAQKIDISNASYASAAGFTTNDVVVYVHANGTLDQTTISFATNTYVHLTAGITVAGASGDYLYELTQQGSLLVGLYGTGYLTNDVLNVTGDVFVSPGDSPVYLVVTGDSNAVLQATSGN